LADLDGIFKISVEGYQEINMAYHEGEADEGLYLVDYDLVDLSIQNSTYIQYIDPTTNKRKEKEGFGLPTIYSYLRPGQLERQKWCSSIR
jgi:hypothetical protein